MIRCRQVFNMIAAATAALGAALALAASPTPVEAQAAGGMPSFASDEELLAFLVPDPEQGLAVAVPPPPPPAPPPAPSPPPPPPGAAPAPAPAFTTSSAGPPNPSITNVQVAGVDEGGIVKVVGEHLVILRRGRLFSVSTADAGLRPVDLIDAFPPGAGGRGWYDERLVSGDLIVVVGYSYERGGTEINRFRIAPDGRLSFVDSHHLRSSDYYSSRNFASRLVGDQLVIYTPLYFDWGDDPLDSLPGLSRWVAGRDGPSFRRIASARQVFIPAPMRADGPDRVEALHSVIRCDLAAPELDCSATVVLGPSGRTFFVSTNAVYVWVSAQWNWRDEGPAYLYRMPLDGGRPSAVQVRGGPVDQFSFHANVPASRLDILVTRLSGGDGMWAPEFAQGQPALLQLPTSRFGDGSEAALPSDYRPLPGGQYINVLHNRFVGDWLLYALNPQDSTASGAQLVAAPLAGGSPVIFPMPTRVDRIERLGGDAVAVSGAPKPAQGVLFTTIDLTSGQLPLLGDRFAEPGTREAESRSHAFFYRPDPDSPDGADGLLGLPVLRTLQPDARHNHRRDLGEVMFVRRDARRLSDYGRLGASDVHPAEDRCQASCVDWYGNARPIFLGDRVFALLGYELVEGEAGGSAIREVQRIDFNPGANQRAQK